MSAHFPLPAVFADYAPPIRPLTPLRSAIAAATRRGEAECLHPLLEEATLSHPQRAAALGTATTLVTALRTKPRGSTVEGLVQEYALSSEEGVALMCLAEALLRVPDAGTRDALIRDKISGGDWRSHTGGNRSLFVNAASWGLVITGKLVAVHDGAGLGAALTRIIARAGEPMIRSGVAAAMRLMGEQFVAGQTIAEALAAARTREARGFGYSYDMLGEAAMTAADAERYRRDYEQAVHAIGAASAGRGIHAGPGISIKLSALHPRYARSQADRAMAELLPRVKALAMLARGYDIGFNIDAEESDRLELSLDLLESLALDPDLAGWNGLGFVVQAYGKRCPFVIDWIVVLARRAGRRLMVRLVKGAYWDAEIKRAQVDGLSDFPVYTRKVHTDVAYVACARRLLAASDAVFPQFATHNAYTLASIHALAGPDFTLGDYEFQCLYGMGEPLYEEVVGAGKLGRPCRIYAPVGTHETLLAYLVRRLLENGANSSFVNRIADPEVQVAELVEDPVETIRASTRPGAPHAGIAAPHALYPDRRNASGLDLCDERVLAALSERFRCSVAPVTAGHEGDEQTVLNPADHRDLVGTVHVMSESDALGVADKAAAYAPLWAVIPVAERAARLERAADAMEQSMGDLLPLIMREAGKSAPNAIAEVREAVDFLRYYAVQARATLSSAHAPLGVVTCISPWNFPLAIFTGQIAAALVAGNVVLAKPAEETPLIASRAIAILHAAGVPHEALRFVPGDGCIGAALVAARATAGVMFTGSTEVARSIQRELAQRTDEDGAPIPLIAETGGQNAMIVDSSALTEQVVADVLASAFDSAGQRCSALRVLCLQDNVADRVLEMLTGAMAEMRVGRTDRITTDVGPVISAHAKSTIESHIASMRALGHTVRQMALDEATAHGTFVAPTIIELPDLAGLEREVFGPVLHVVRFRRPELGVLIDGINATGYGLTFGLHTRLDETIEFVTSRVGAGNIYVNRNVIGAVVGVQPFGGRGLSGTGPKAGGPLYLGRLVRDAPASFVTGRPHETALSLAAWLERTGDADAVEVRGIVEGVPETKQHALPGPVGERNLYSLHPRGRILLLPETRKGLLRQLAAALANGNTVVVGATSALCPNLPDDLSTRITWCPEWAGAGPFAGALVEGDRNRVVSVQRMIAELPGPLVLTQAEGVGYRHAWLVEEVSISINTTAAGGNASLLTLA